MLKNYFKTAWRALRKDRMHSFINIIGLSIGMSVAILISLWLYDELSFNRTIKNHSRIARVIQNVTNNGEVQTWQSVPYPLAEELRKNYGSDFKHIAMSVDMGEHLVTIGDKKLKITGGYFEKDMPLMLEPDVLKGSLNGLQDPSAILISASAAKAIFGQEDPINKMIRIDEMPPMKVTCVYKDFQKNSDFSDLNFFSSWEIFYKERDVKGIEDPWRPNFITLFVQINDQADFAKVSGKIKDAKFKKVNEQLQKKKPALFLAPMANWHLYSEFKDGVNVGGAIKYVRMFAIIGLFVLLLACINFMNLSTARSGGRAKEIGIRKTVGSLKAQLVLQFFCESFLTVLFAFLLSVLFAWLGISFFNEVSNKQLAIPWSNAGFWFASALFIVVISLIAGSYPAFYLSSFKPVEVLKGTFKAGRFAAIPRRVLVVLQFTVSVSLIVGTMMVYRQIQFAKNRPVGYSRANLVMITSMNAAIHDHFDVVKEELIQTGTVTSVAESQSPTTAIWNSSSGFSWPGKDPNLSTDFGVVSASYDYGKTINWLIKEGRGFSKDFATDSSAIILNEAAVHYMNLKDPVGKTMTWWDRSLQVIGVIQNMVIQSPYDEAKPVMFVLATDPGNMAVLRLNPTVAPKNALAKIEPIFKKLNPDQPFSYRFADKDYDEKFGNEERIAKLAGIFAIIAVIISSLGLFGLTSFVVEQRKKEVGVRKVLGASSFKVWHLLSKDFLLLVLISFLIAFPLSFYFMHGWLQNYSYRTPLSVWVFIAAGAGVLVITLITVSVQSIKAARANPVKSLRTE